MFLVVLFLAKRTDFFERTINFVKGGNRAELVYGDATVADLVNKDSDGDGIPDWEEPLWGLDPTKKETTPGVPDSTVIAKLKAENGYNLDTTTQATQQPEENLTQTDKFSRELFSTTAALSQNGAIDQTTVDKISDSLTDHVKNTPVRKIYVFADIKPIKDNSAEAIKKYVATIDSLDKGLNKKYPTTGTTAEILKKFVADGNNVNIDALTELDPHIKQSRDGINEMLKISVPSELAQVHLDIINATERIMENLLDLQLFDTDPVVAMSGMSKYEQNMDLYTSAFEAFINTINKRLNK